MARRTQVLLVDDLDGSDLGTNGTTVEFAVDGTAYEIDLSDRNAKAFHEAVGQYVEHARRVTRSGSGTRRRNSSVRTSMDREESHAIRAWAKVNGWPELGDRGRIPFDVVDAYNRKQPRLPEPPAEKPADKPKVNDSAVKPAEKPAEKTAEKTAVKPAAKAEGTSANVQRNPAANSTTPAKAEGKDKTPAKMPA